MAIKAGVAKSRPRVQLTPSRPDLIDATALFVLGMIAMFELRSTYSGWNFFVVGAVGIILGVVIAHISNAMARPFIVLVVMGLAAFFLLGGVVALRDAPGGSVLPTGSTLNSLANVSIHGWKDLLTTLPPVDGTGNLLVLPYILGLFCGLGGFALARRTRQSFSALFAPVAVFILVILLGSDTPKDTAVLATLFAVIALVWASVRSVRQRPVAATGAARNTRAGVAVALLTVAALGAYALGPDLPGASAHERLVLRKHVNPPIDIENYPSPLAEFREYVGKQMALNSEGQAQLVTLVNKPLFSVGGTLPVGSPIRFATLDTYNGIVWAASTSVDTLGYKPDTFLRVGPKLDNPSTGATYSMDVKIDNYDDYWMPDAGDVQAVSFTDPNYVQQSGDFRYNLTTGTGVLPSKVTQGMSYDLQVAGINEPQLKPSDNLASDGSGDAGAFLKDAQKMLSGQSGSITSQVLTMAANLKSDGRYTDGNPGSHFEYYLPGSSVGRLTDFVKGVIPGVLYVGDDEQYAAAYALMIEDLGVPARVVVGVEKLPASRVVTGSDVDAWVEVQTVDGSWRAIPTEDFLDKNNPPDTKQLQTHTQHLAGAVVPPPPQGRPVTTLDDAAQSVGDSNDVIKKKAAALHKALVPLPGWLGEAFTILGGVLGLVLLICFAIIGAKELRRRRRRGSGPPAVRLARGWREVLDHARDLGRDVPPRRTRREQAFDLALPGLTQLAKQADAHVFGPAEITDQDVATFWSEVGQTRKHMSGTVGRWRRLRASLSLRTFFPAPGVS